jgi:hypothetical protein
MEASGAARLAVTTLALQTPDADIARRQAAEILSQDRFHEPEVPRPLKGVFDWIGERIEPVTGPVGATVSDFVEWARDVVPGADAGLWVILATFVLVTSALVAANLGARRARLRVSEGGLAGTGRREYPAALERAAAEAERRGDLEGAVRLRFRAGLLRLARVDLIEWHPSLTSGRVARAVRSPAFDELAASFDAIVYGGRSAHASDVDLARTKWPRVLEEVQSR